MKTNRKVLFAALGQILSCAALGQGAFANLDFESPITPLDSIYPPGNPTTVLFSNAFPGWAGYVGTNLASVARIDGVNLDNATLAIIRSNVALAQFAPLIQSNYTAVLQAQRDPNDIGGGSLVPVSILQSGLVPSTSLSLRFKGYTAGTQFAVSLGGVNLPIFELQSFPNYKLYGCDIEAFANQSLELRFTAYPNNYPRSTVFALDSILFSNEKIPEPSMLGLLLLGALWYGLQHCRKSRQVHPSARGRPGYAPD